MTHKNKLFLICSLQEEILRLRMVNDASKKETSAAFQNPYSPPQLAQQQLPVKYIAIAIAMALFGWILGKFVLWINDIDRNVTATASVADAGVKNFNHQQWKIQKKNQELHIKQTNPKQMKKVHTKYRNHQNQHATINDYFKRGGETKTKMIQV